MVLGLELWVFGVLSAVIGLFGYAPYIRDTVSGKNKPERCSWLIWSVLGTLAFFSQLYEGATQSLWFAGTQVSATILVFLLSIRKGAGHFMSVSYFVVLGIAAIGLYAWYFTETAAYALFLTIGVSFVGGSLTVRKAYHHPETETPLTWVLALLSSALALLSVGRIDWILLAYPLYLFTLYAAILMALFLANRRRQHAGYTPGILN